MVAPTITGAFLTIADHPEQTGTFQIQFNGHKPVKIW